MFRGLLVFSFILWAYSLPGYAMEDEENSDKLSPFTPRRVNKDEDMPRQMSLPKDELIELYEQELQSERKRYNELLLITLELAKEVGRLKQKHKQQPLLIFFVKIKSLIFQSAFSYVVSFCNCVMKVCRVFR